MRDAYEVLRQKESELDRVRKEIESLKIVEPLLSEDTGSDDASENIEKSGMSFLNETISRLSDSAATNVDNLFPSDKASHSRFWNSLKRASNH
jgi:hypothetical protein